MEYSPMDQTQPAPATARNQLIDAVRGLAIFGILVINMGYLAWPKVRNWPIYPMSYQTTSDLVVDFLVRLVAKGKFYIIFSFLFGLGMAMQRDRMQQGFTWFFTRRLVVLMGIGAVHGLVIWNGDILLIYALTGLLLLPFQKADARVLLGAAVLLFVVQFGWHYAMPLWADFQAETAKGGPWKAAVRWAGGEAYATEAYAKALTVYKSGDWLAVAELRYEEFSSLVKSLPSWGLDLLISFLLGAWAWRKGLFTEPGAHSALLTRIMVWFGLVGAVTNLASFVILDLDLFGLLSTVGFTCWFLGKFFLGYAYLAALLLIWDRGWLKGFFAVLAPVGRMALTNYLMHSVVFTLLFNSYGLGYMGDFGDTMVFALAVTMFLFQIPFSHWWLGRFRFGPAEWLWRSLTYLKLQPFRR